MDFKKLLSVRNKAKKRKPGFVVKESKYQAGVKARWRYPRGLHSPVRQRFGGRPALPRPGYGSPRSIRGLHSSGLAKVLVSTEAELLTIEAGKQGAVIRSTVGGRKRLRLLQLAQEKKIKVLNVKDVAKRVEGITKAFELRTKAKVTRSQEKNRKEEEKLKKAEEKKKQAEKAKQDAEKNMKAAEAGSKSGEVGGAAAIDKQEQEREAIEKELVKKQG
jgi:large subunit ribosomal protein L32e